MKCCGGRQSPKDDPRVFFMLLRPDGTETRFESYQAGIQAQKGSVPGSRLVARPRTTDV